MNEMLTNFIVYGWIIPVFVGIVTGEIMFRCMDKRGWFDRWI